MNRMDDYGLRVIEKKLIFKVLYQWNSSYR